MVEDEKILKFLRKHPKQLFSVKEIADILESTIHKIAKDMRRLMKYDLVKIEKINRMVATKLFGPDYKRGLALYYYEEEL